LILRKRRRRQGAACRTPWHDRVSWTFPETAMDETIAPPTAPQHSLWMRFFYMLLMGLAFHLAAWVLGLLAIVQLAMAAFAGGPNPRLQTVGAGLGRYFGQLARFLTFQSDDLPFPFADWPTAGS
jgi:hypothetical protein